LSWIEHFDELAPLGTEDRQLFETRARIIELGPNQVVFAPGKKPDAFLLVLQGTIQLHQYGASGREIVLYRVSGGESCIMTTACLLSDEDYLAEGVTETPVTAVALGRGDFDTLIARSLVFRRFVFSKYASRVTRLMELVEDVALERIDKRLARKLLELAQDEQSLYTTHQSLAVELGSAREVIPENLRLARPHTVVHVPRLQGTRARLLRLGNHCSGGTREQYPDLRRHQRGRVRRDAQLRVPTHVRHASRRSQK
jgi:CRP/FNR family transcriptional regulator